VTTGSIRSVRIVGTGLVGTSLGLALRAAGVDSQLLDSDPDRLSTAVGRGAGRAVTQGDPPPDVVVVCVPPSLTADLVDEQLRAHPGAIVMDVASVKGPIVADLLSRVGVEDLGRFVPSHPMSGREVSGPEGALADLFRDRVWVLTPTEHTAAMSVETAEELLGLVGAVSRTVSPAQHDDAVAVVSHVPQLVSSALAAALADTSDQALDLAGPGLRDTTRIAGSDAGLWVDVVRANAPAVRQGLAAVRANLDRLEEVLATGDDPGPAVRDLLVRGAAGRSRIPGRHGGDDPQYAGVVVQLLDAPGQLAGLFAAVGMADVNVLDVRMEHALGRPTGLIELLVSADQSLALGTALRDAGFDVRS